MARPDLSPEQEALLKRVREAWESFDNTLGKQYRTRWDEMYRMYRTHRELGRHLSTLPGVDARVSELEDQWGSDLRIPYAFSTVETINARMLSNSPKMLILPRDQVALSNVRNMRMTIDAQQEQIRYPLTCQTTGKTGQIYGIGFQKAMWRVEQGKRRYNVPSTGMNPFEWATEEWSGKAFDDPDAFDIDPWCMAWDPFADGPENCEWWLHRTFRSLGYVMGRIKQAQEARARNEQAAAEAIATGQPQPPREPPKGWYMLAHLTEDDVRAMGSSDRETEVWAERKSAAGLGGSTWNSSRGEQRHEVWEFHCGSEVITILDREIPACVHESDLDFGEAPFHAYRPREVPHEMVGIGAIEPAKDLFYELNLTRSMRADLSALGQTPVFAYREGTVDPGQMQVYPGALWPVLGEPKDLLHRVQLADVPASSYQDEDRTKADIERVTGLGDVVLGAASTGGGTATEAQLQLASANVLIQVMGRRFEVEIIESVCQQFLDMNQKHIVGNRGYAKQLPNPLEPDPDKRWQWFDVGPQELAGQMWAKSAGGAEAQNVPQMRADAQMEAQLLIGNPHIDQRVAWVSVLEKLGFTDPESVLAPDDVVPPETLEIGAQMIGEKVAQLLGQAQQAAEQAQQQAAKAQPSNGDGKQAPAQAPPQPAPPPDPKQITQGILQMLQDARDQAMQQGEQGQAAEQAQAPQ